MKIYVYLREKYSFVLLHPSCFYDSSETCLMNEPPEEQKTPVASQSSPVRSQNLISSRIRTRSRYSLPPKTPVRTPSRTRSGSTQRLRRVSGGETPKLKRSSDGRSTPVLRSTHGVSPRRNSIRRVPTTPYALRALKTLTPRGARRQSTTKGTPLRENSQYTPTKDLRSLSRLLLKERNQGTTENHDLSIIENKSTSVHETLPLPDLSEFTDIAMPEGVVQQGIFSPSKAGDQEAYQDFNLEFNQDSILEPDQADENHDNGTFTDDEPLFGMDLSLLEPAIGDTPPKQSLKSPRKTNELLPKSMILKLVKYKTEKIPVGSDLYPTLQSISDEFFTQMSEDLCRYAEHGRRSMINFSDIQLLTQRINKNLASIDQTTENNDIMTIARESLDLEQLIELENMIHLNQLKKSTKKNL